MAIHLECLNWIVPIKTIQKKYAGGWGKCLDDDAQCIGGVWHDAHLFRAGGAMNSMDMMEMVWHWKDLGFHTQERGNKGITMRNRIQ